MVVYRVARPTPLAPLTSPYRRLGRVHAVCNNSTGVCSDLRQAQTRLVARVHVAAAPGVWDSVSMAGFVGVDLLLRRRVKCRQLDLSCHMHWSAPANRRRWQQSFVQKCTGVSVWEMKTAYFYDSNKRSAAVPGKMRAQISSPSRQHGWVCSILRASAPRVSITQTCTSTYACSVHCIQDREKERATRLLRCRGTDYRSEAEQSSTSCALWKLNYSPSSY
jgi:hypothetical protein